VNPVDGACPTCRRRPASLLPRPTGRWRKRWPSKRARQQRAECQDKEITKQQLVNPTTPRRSKRHATGSDFTGACKLLCATSSAPTSSPSCLTDCLPPTNHQLQGRPATTTRYGDEGLTHTPTLEEVAKATHTHTRTLESDRGHTHTPTYARSRPAEHIDAPGPRARCRRRRKNRKSSQLVT